MPDAETTRLLPRDVGGDGGIAGTKASIPSTSSHRRQRRSVRRWMVLCAGAFAAFDLCGRAYEKAVYGIGDDDAAVALTKAQYRSSKGALRELRWTPTQGFFLVNGAGFFCKSWFGNANFETWARDVFVETFRKHFPSRIEKTQSAFSILYTVQDAPFTPCLNATYAKDNCDFDSWVPIYAFGSTPRNASALPTMVRAPLVTLVECFVDRIGDSPDAARAAGQAFNETPSCGFLNYETEKYTTMDKCHALSNDVACKPYDRGLFTLNSVDDPSLYSWDSLESKLFWRGNDFWFLSSLYPEGKISSEWFVHQVASAPESEREKLIKFHLSGKYIGPRTRAVFMSLLQPDRIDAKFFDWGNFTGSKENRLEDGRVLGIDAYERSTEETTAKYRYQIDLGGGGGTTFTGTISKLSMPGVLLHHTSPTVDSYFSFLKPWTHYVPVDVELQNLEERLDWLDQNPDKAHAISKAATEWTKWFRKVSTLLMYHDRTLVQPLRAHIDPQGQHYVATPDTQYSQSH